MSGRDEAHVVKHNGSPRKACHLYNSLRTFKASHSAELCSHGQFGALRGPHPWPVSRVPGKGLLQARPVQWQIWTEEDCGRGHREVPLLHELDLVDFL